jgi:sulfonate transport system permease protein
VTAATAARVRRLGHVSLTLSGVAIVAVLWIVGGRAGWGRGMVITPWDAVRPIVGSSHDVYWRATKATAWEALRGLAIGSVVAFVAALLAGTVPALRRSITRLAAIANAAPWVAVAPCLLVILGRDRGPVAVAAIAVFFFVFVSTSIGLGAAPAAAHDVATALGMGAVKRVWIVQLPACWPSVVDGLRLAAPAALAGAVFGEWYGAPRGLGVLLIGAMQSGRPERLWAASLLSAACGLAAFALLGAFRLLLVRRFGRAIAQAPPPAARSHGRVRVLAVETATIVVLTAALVFAWWLWIEAKDISPLVVPRPSAAWNDLSDSPGVYASAAGATLLTAAIAFGIGAGAGLLAAVAATRARVLAGMIVPVVVVLAATPLVALFPLFARVFGYQPNTVRLLAALMVFFPVFVYARSGLTAAGAPTLDVVDALGGTAATRFRLVVLPAAVPHIVSGARIAAGSAVIAAVVGESLIGREGLGVQFSRAYRLLELPRAFGAAIVIVVVSVTVFAVAGWLERVVHARWT